jgi:hypothetical protein
MNTREFIEFKTESSLVGKLYDTHAVIELMRSWQEYNDVGRMLYSFDPSLKQDELGIFTEDDFLTYLTNKNETN